MEAEIPEMEMVTLSRVKMKVNVIMILCLLTKKSVMVSRKKNEVGYDRLWQGCGTYKVGCTWNESHKGVQFYCAQLCKGSMQKITSEREEIVTCESLCCRHCIDNFQ